MGVLVLSEPGIRRGYPNVSCKVKFMSHIPCVPMNDHDERGTTMTGVDPSRLDDQQLMKELETIHRTRHDTLLYGSNERGQAPPPTEVAGRDLVGQEVLHAGQCGANGVAARDVDVDAEA